MANLINPRPGYPMSFDKLRRQFGYGGLYEFLQGLAIKDRVRVLDDFTDKALDTTNKWTVAAGDTATTWAITAGLNGFLRGITGATAATSGLQLITPWALFSGDKNMDALVRWKSDVLDELRVEIGFVNALPSVNTTVVNSLTTPTFNTTAQACLAVYDHTGSTTTTGLYMIGSDVAANKQTFTTTARRPTAGSYQWVRVVALGDYVYLFTDSYLAASATTQAIQGGDALKFAISIKSSDTNSKNIDVDLVDLQVNRT